MPSYYYVHNKIVIDTENAEGTLNTQNTIGISPTARNTEAHEQFTRDALTALASTQGGDEDLIYDKLISYGGHVFLDTSYDHDDFFATLEFHEYFPTEADYNAYQAWLMTIDLFERQRIENSDQTPEELFNDPNNSPGRGYTELTKKLVDFNKPYRT